MCQPDRKQLNKCWMEPWENHNGKAENQKVLKALQDVLGGKKDINTDHHKGWVSKADQDYKEKPL